jgi:tRNA(Ile)-lysidine synthase
MIAAGDSILVAASGGPDSIALVHSLFQIAQDQSIPIALAHLHHGLRGAEADRDAEFVARQATAMGLRLFSDRLDVHAYRRRHRLSLEEAARKLRYASLRHMADRHGFSKIAVGHHADDSAESILLFLLRGAGPRGLGGIAPKRGRFVRPLIDQRREQILAYLEENDIPYVVDSTNADRRFLRNRIRHDLIPQLSAEYNPQLTESLLRLSTIVQAEDRWMDELAEKMFEKAVIGEEPERLSLSVSRLAALPEAACRRVLRKTVTELQGDLRRIGFRHLEAVGTLLHQKKGTGELHLPRGLRVFRCYDRLEFCQDDRLSQADAPKYRLCIEAPGEFRLPVGGLLLRLSVCGPVDFGRLARSGQQVAFFDMGKFCFPVTVRNVRPGDRFRPSGMAGTQKVFDFFVNRKVPRHLRSSCPLLVCGGKIAWVVGHRTAEDFRAGPESRQVLRAELLADPD